MMDTTSNLGDYRLLFWVKVSALHLLELNEQLYLLDHYINYCQTHIFHYLAESADTKVKHGVFDDYPAINREVILFTQEHILKFWQLELLSAQEWRARVVARAEGLEADSTSARDHSATFTVPIYPATDPNIGGNLS
jgi:hypothetical protein